MTSTIEAIVLNKENRAENFISFTLLSRDLGLCYAFAKISQSKNSPLPDFFNEISIEANKANYNFFIKSINSIEVINNFTKNYQGLVECSKLAQCIIKNAKHLEDFNFIYDDFLLALKAYSTEFYPEIINIKWLYKFAKREGYPIIEDFAQSLNLEYQNIFVDIIKSPSAKCKTKKEELNFIYKNLALWLNSQTDIIYT